MAENRKKKSKKVATWKHSGEAKPFVHEKLWHPEKDEELLIHTTNSIKIK